MPERGKAVTNLAERVAGGPWVWNGATGEITNHRGTGLTTDLYDDLRAVLDDLFIEVMRSVDWKRVLLEASARHSAAREQDVEGHTPDDLIQQRAMFGDAVCDECVQEALLTGDRVVDWDKPGAMVAVESSRRPIYSRLMAVFDAMRRGRFEPYGQLLLTTPELDVLYELLDRHIATRQQVSGGHVDLSIHNSLRTAVAEARPPIRREDVGG